MTACGDVVVGIRVGNGSAVGMVHVAVRCTRMGL